MRAILAALLVIWLALWAGRFQTVRPDLARTDRWAVVLIVAVVFFVVLGIFLLQGRSLALTFSIFLQGVNAIVRLMVFFSNSFSNDGSVNVVYLVTCLMGLGLSIWLLLRLDRQDVRLNMIR